MPLKEGSDPKTIRHNIEGILDKKYGYDPPYLDPAREEYTPAQAAAIAYAKAGKRNNVGKGKGKGKPAKAEPGPKVPEGWSTKQPSDSEKKKAGTKKEPAKATGPEVPEGWSDKKGGAKFEPNGDLTVDGERYVQGPTLPGSTKPKLFKGSGGKAKVVKEGGAKGQNFAEHTAQKVMQKMGGMGINSELVDGKLVNDYISNAKTIGEKAQELGMSDNPLKVPGVKVKLIANAATDALLANWDMVGLDADNIMITDDGSNMYKIDAGGTFNYRAQGDNKEYGSVPIEMVTFQKKGQLKDLFTDASPQFLEHFWADQSNRIASKSDALSKIVGESQLPDEVKKAFNDRLEVYKGFDKIFQSKGVQSLLKSGLLNWKQLNEAASQTIADLHKLDKSGNLPEDIKQAIFLSMTSKSAKILLNSAPDQKKESSPTSPASSFQELINKNNPYITESKFNNRLNQANKMLSKKMAGWEDLAKLSDDEKYSVNDYTMTGYEKLNKYLRFGVIDAENHHKKSRVEYFETKAKSIEEGLNKLPSYTGGPVLRADKISLKRANQIDEIKNLKPGDQWVSSGFDSYSTLMEGDVASDFLHPSTTHYNFLSIYEGKNAKYVAPISDIGDEEECLLQRNTKTVVKEIKELTRDECESMFPAIGTDGFDMAVGDDPNATLKLIYFIDA